MENEHAPMIESARRKVNDSSDPGKKSFIFHLLGENPLLDPDSVFARLALQQSVLRIANSYFGMLTRLRYYNVWHTFTTQTEARESQLWHRDREDYLILKVFVYLSDVDEGAGPFVYAAGTHLKGSVRREPAFSLEGNVKRSDDSQMAAVVPADRWVRCTGPRGTIVFADTRGYHKGGLARETDRVMYTCMFTSQASQSQEFLRRPETIAYPKGKDLAFALTTPGTTKS
jgi:hypothetical protein